MDSLVIEFVLEMYLRLLIFPKDPAPYFVRLRLEVFLLRSMLRLLWHFYPLSEIPPNSFNSGNMLAKETPCVSIFCVTTKQLRFAFLCHNFSHEKIRNDFQYILLCVKHRNKRFKAFYVSIFIPFPKHLLAQYPLHIPKMYDRLYNILIAEK